MSRRTQKQLKKAVESEMMDSLGKLQPGETLAMCEEIRVAVKEERAACIQVVTDLMERTSYSDGHMACRAIRDALRARDNATG